MSRHQSCVGLVVVVAGVFCGGMALAQPRAGDGSFALLDPGGLGIVPLAGFELVQRDLTERAREGAVKVASSENPATVAELGKPQDKGKIIIRGRVLDPDGKPFAGAKVLAISHTFFAAHVDKFVKQVDETTTSEDGEFAVSLPNEPQFVFGHNEATLQLGYEVIASAKGYALDWQTLTRESDGSFSLRVGWDWKTMPRDDVRLSLQLAKDPLPIEGRVLNLEGRPVAGVRLRVASIAMVESSLDDWIAQMRDFRPESRAANAANGNNRQTLNRAPWFTIGKRLWPGPCAMLPEAVTGDDGRFRLQGLGADRQVTLRVEGDSVAKTFVDVITRPMTPVSKPQRGDSRESGIYFGASFDYTAQPTQIVTGVVRDADSGQPLAGAQVEVVTLPGDNLGVEGFISSTTDGEGRYRLVGIPKAQAGGNPTRIRVLPLESQPYFRTQIDVPRGDNLAPITCDIAMKRTSVVHGRITDKATGKPVPSRVFYVPFLDNPHAKNHPKFRADRFGSRAGEWYRTADDGTYRVPAIPGRGVVLAVGLEVGHYRRGAGADEIGWAAQRPRRLPNLVYGVEGPGIANSVRAVEIGEQDAEATCDLHLVPLQQQIIRLLDPAGAPLSGVDSGGNLSGAFHDGTYDVMGDTAVVWGLEVNQREMLLLMHKERRLGAAVVVEHQKTTEIRLAPCATISGRVVDSDGQPQSRRPLYLVIPRSESPLAPEGQYPGPPHLWTRFSEYTAVSDSDGRFQFDLVLPGVRYEINAAHQGARADILADVANVKPGETIDVGTVTMTSAGEGPPAGRNRISSGGPAGRGGFGARPQLGDFMPRFVQDELKLSDAQKQQLADLQKALDAKLDTILTDDQKKQYKEMKENSGRGGPGGPNGRGGPGGPQR